MTEMYDGMGSGWIEQFISNLYQIEEQNIKPIEVKIGPNEIVVGVMSTLQKRLWTRALQYTDEMLDLEFSIRKSNDEQECLALINERTMARRIHQLCMSILHMEVFQTYGKPDFPWEYGFREEWRIVRCKNMFANNSSVRGLQMAGVLTINGKKIEEFYRNDDDDD